MKKYLSIFNIHTLIVIVLSLLSSYVCLYFHFKLYIDFLILSFVIVFPLTFSMRVAFRRRERALEYLSQFKSSLQSIVYVFGHSKKVEAERKQEFKNIAANISDELIDYLAKRKDEANAVQKASHSIYVFVQTNRGNIKGSLASKVLLNIHRLNDSIEFLLATRRHTIPWGPKFLVLFAIYTFVIFYPASLLNETGFNEPLWYVFVMTGFKALLLIFFYNIQNMLQDPFDQNSPDGIRVNDFRFTYQPEPVVIIQKKEKTLNEKTELPEEKLISEEKELSGKKNE